MSKYKFLPELGHKTGIYSDENNAWCLAYIKAYIINEETNTVENAVVKMDGEKYLKYVPYSNISDVA